MFSPELRAQAESLIGRYPVGRSALLPLLHLVQSQDGYVSDDGIAECAELLALTKAEVNAVATFYTMYKRRPLGRHLVSVCTNFACEVRGAGEVYAELSSKLGVGHNETTPDGAITLEHAECLGNCDGAPVITVDYMNYERLDAEGAVALVERVAAGDVPAPTRGFPSRGIRDVEYRLAGLGAAPDGDGMPTTTTNDAAAAEVVRPEEQAGLSPQSGSSERPESPERDEPTDAGKDGGKDA